ncbi:hypothetical protein ZOSMA_62G00190 [Zostera marina]|uniref:SWIM-type domain-containing protein n=1 Tax=Zostera marina TaxID=29655 RepID=A0A0K9NT54_ZOSMR|nr:hypothetical protein ZOSMA_62G00190 [Zostera marina]
MKNTKQLVSSHKLYPLARLQTINGTQIPTCSCGMFTSKNIPCRHIISLLNFFSITDLPTALTPNVEFKPKYNIIYF